MADFQPPPTYALPILVEEKTGKAIFNPIWLNWFLELARTLDNAGGTVLNTWTAQEIEDLIGGIFADSSTIDITYNSGTPSITAAIIADSVNNAFLAEMAAGTIKGRATNAGTGNPTDLTVADWGLVKPSVDTGATQTIYDGRQYITARRFTVAGTGHLIAEGTGSLVVI